MSGFGYLELINQPIPNLRGIATLLGYIYAWTRLEPSLKGFEYLQLI